MLCDNDDNDDDSDDDSDDDVVPIHTDVDNSGNNIH
jgi:hypothetical protein